MRRVWRICRRPFVAEALSGRGGLAAAGRWHPRGLPVVYCAESPALAALETLVHVEAAEAPADLRLLAVDLPNDCSTETVSAESLSRGWRRSPPGAATQDLGRRWLVASKSLVLIVPSALVPESFNVLINPRHPEAARLRVASSRAFSFDHRLV